MTTEEQPVSVGTLDVETWGQNFATEAADPPAEYVAHIVDIVRASAVADGWRPIDEPRRAGVSAAFRPRFPDEVDTWMSPGLAEFVSPDRLVCWMQHYVVRVVRAEGAT